VAQPHFTRSGSAETDARLRDAQALIGRLQDAFASLPEQQHSAVDSSGTITVTVDGSGQLLDVAVSAHAVRNFRYAEIGPAVLEALQGARTLGMQGMQAAVEEASGTDVGASNLSSDAALPHTFLPLDLRTTEDTA